VSAFLLLYHFRIFQGALQFPNRHFLRVVKLGPGGDSQLKTADKGMRNGGSREVAL
jgi:hypothetical protein